MVVKLQVHDCYEFCNRWSGGSNLLLVSLSFYYIGKYIGNSLYYSFDIFHQMTNVAQLLFVQLLG